MEMVRSQLAAVVAGCNSANTRAARTVDPRSDGAGDRWKINSVDDYLEHTVHVLGKLAVRDWSE
jgi:hypothetical protein